MKLPTGVGQKKMKNIDTVVSKLKIRKFHCRSY